jgi:hypothetical protein
MTNGCHAERSRAKKSISGQVKEILRFAQYDRLTNDYLDVLGALHEYTYEIVE